MAIITLLTDFGLEDAYAGIVKGVILSVNPSATIVDISHNIAPQDLSRAAYLIGASYEYFSPGTVHVVVVDPGVGGDRAIVGVEIKGHQFLAPDNGVLTAVLAERSADRVVRVENNNLFLECVSRTFHGRDIFAPVAGHLSMGLDLGALGPGVDPETLVRLHLPQPVSTDTGEIVGAVITSDRFGNLITNIREQDLIPLIKKIDVSGLTIQMGDRTIHGLSESYTSVALGEPLAVIGSSGCLELSVNGGNALNFFKTGPDEAVRIRKKIR
jgi:S-adenosyl-L-methionine hydrolase (adenosine-forming)